MAYDEETFKHIRQGGMKTSAAESLATVVYDHENGALGGGGGALHLDTISSDFTTTAVSTYTTVTGLTLSITPSVNSLFLLNARIGMFTTASDGVDLNAKAILSPSPAVGSAQVRARDDFGRSNVGRSFPLVSCWSLTADTEYTITVQVYQGSAGTLTVYSDSSLTELVGVLIPVA